MGRAERTSTVVSVRASAEQWLLDLVPQALIGLDGNALITFVNRAAERLLDRDPRELFGHPLEPLLTGEGRAILAEHLSRVRRDAMPRRLGRAGDLYVQCGDGQSLPVELELTHATAPDGAACSVVALTDISEHLRREDELRRSRRDLEELAYVASHELQEPLRMVSSFLGLLDRRYRGQLDERADRYIHFAVDGAARMQRMLQDLLAYSRVGTRSGPLTRVELAHVAQAALAPLSRVLLESGAQVELGSLPAVLGDEVQLRQVFAQLFDNALKFHGPEALRVQVSAQSQGGWVRVSVLDNGIGLDMQHAERVLGMFERLHEIGKYPGNGMGLALAKRIVERHAGKIWLDSQPGSGTTVFFTLREAAVEP